MNRYSASMVLVVALAGCCVAQNATAVTYRTLPRSAICAFGAIAQQEPGNAQAASVISIALSKSLDAKKLKVGDPVEARTTAVLSANGATIPRGSLVKGHITQASARSKGGEQSALGIVFDSIVPKSGQPMPLKASIQAVGASPVLSPMLQSDSEAPIGGNPGSPGSPTVTSPPMVGGGNPSPLGGVQRPASNLPPDSSSQQSGPNSATLDEKSTGVVGLRNVQLQAGSTLVSNGKDLKLDAGTEMILRVQSQ